MSDHLFVNPLPSGASWNKFIFPQALCTFVLGGKIVNNLTLNKNIMSVTIVGLIILVLSYLSKSAGFELHIGEAEISELIRTVAEIIGLATTFYGGIRHGDITWYGKRVVSGNFPIIDSLPDDEIK